VGEAIMNNVWTDQLIWKQGGLQATGEKKGGGQGDARPNLRTGDVAFLKVLKSQNDPERRVRMYREAAALPFNYIGGYLQSHFLKLSSLNL
jgi:eukaryotic-like serine/threonine-protein kinase